MSASWSAAATAATAKSRPTRRNRKYLACRSRVRARAPACVRSTPKPLAESKGERACLALAPIRPAIPPPSLAGARLSLARGRRPAPPPPRPSLFSLPCVCVAGERARARRVTPPPLHLLPCPVLFPPPVPSAPPPPSLARSLFSALPSRTTPLRNVTPTSGEGARIEHMTRERAKNRSAGLPRRGGDTPRF